jgi:asparagine synthase (glutamine-hydrolysing)
MCGIAGYIKLRDFDEALFINNACRLMRERGPDRQDYYKSDKVGLIHTRLSIIDLSERGNQPMWNNTKDVAITFNGEIYNFKELKSSLQSLYAFQTGSDTEILLAGYQVWGIEKLLSRIEGMFAFGIYDSRAEKLFLARDHFGKKPLYYYRDADVFLFSSDIRSIRNAKKDKLTLNYNALDYYLVELSTPQPQSIWLQVQQIPPASFIAVDIKSQQIQLKNYWQLSAKDTVAMTLDDTISLAKENLTRAILKRTVSDVPIGCFLSGGIDSGLVVSLLAQNSSQSINTFSIGLNYETMNELPDARIVAEKYGTNHHEIVLEADVVKILPRLLEYVGEPFADSSLIPSYYVCQALSGKVKVALSGDGGDEMFGGYENYGLAYRTDDYLKHWSNNPLRRLYVFYDKIKSRATKKAENAGAYEHYSNLTGFERIFRQMGFDTGEREHLYTDSFLIETGSYSEHYLNEQWDKNRRPLFVDTLMLASVRTRLLNDYLVKVDRASMINSLEVRSPFLDKDLAEWAFSVPASYKFHGKTNKYILKQIAKEVIGPHVLDRPKRGFGIPVSEWLRNELKTFLLEHMNSDSFLVREKIIQESYMQQILKEHLSGIANHRDKIWALLCFEIWIRGLD